MSKTTNFIELFTKTVDVSKNDYTIKELNAIVKDVYMETYKVKKSRKTKVSEDGIIKSTKPLSPYNIFMKDRMAELKRDHPEMNGKEKFKIIAEEWNAQKAK
uniref:HMG box domain-containing protein n=1 Tax=viral metagenome TaxID=1070528 RepID=A0A6C0J2G8_9ZZZZ